MNQLNEEYLNSLIYRHRDSEGFPLYLNYFGYRKDNEPFQLISTKALSVHEATDRFLLHGLDMIEQKRNILMMLSQRQWYSRTTFHYINSQLQFLLPQNIKICIIDLADLKNTPAAVLRTVMRSSGIREIEKEDAANIKKFEKFIQFQWSEYKRKYYYVLFRSDNLSFAQLRLLRSLSVRSNETTPLVFFLLEGSNAVSDIITGLRKDGINDLVYSTFTILYRGSFDTVLCNVEKKLGREVQTIMTLNLFRKLFYWADGMPIYPLLHSILFRMSAHGINMLVSDNDAHQIAFAIQKENDEFIARSPEYKSKLEKKDYIFPPELLRDGPSITEARRFFRWMGWEE